jgi:hypothetical protein
MLSIARAAADVPLQQSGDFGVAVDQGKIAVARHKAEREVGAYPCRSRLMGATLLLNAKSIMEDRSVGNRSAEI